MTEDVYSFANDIDWFVKHIGSRKHVLPTFAHAASTVTENTNKTLNKFIEDHAYDKVYEDGKLKSYGVPEEYVGRHRVLVRSLRDMILFADLLPKMTLVSLISLFDGFLARLLRGLLKIRPEILSTSEKQLSFALISEFDSVETLKEYIVESEIESILRENHTYHFEWIERRLSMPLRKELDIWPNFVELTERRNLFVHSDGIVNRQYILNCTNASYKLPDDLKLGDHLRVAPDYYDRSCDCVAELGVKLAYVLWSKLLPNDKEKADESAISTIYDFLHVREYRLAEILARFLISPPFKHSCYESTLILTINLAIALRGQDKHDEVKSLINGIDWTALSLKFKLASKTLLEEYDEAASIMRAIGQSGDVSKLSYHQWPLFRWFRRSDQFKSAYQDVFEEPFKIIQQKNSSNSNEDSAESETPADESTSQG